MESWAGSWASELCLRWTPQATEIAYLLTGDDVLARRIARRAVLRCSAHWHDRRNPYALEQWFDRTVTSLAGRAVWNRGLGRILGPKGIPAPAPQGLDRSELRVWQELQALRFRQRGALVLRYHGGLADPELADALGCSVSGLRSLLSRGLEALRTRVGPGIDVDSVLEELLPRLARQLKPQPPGDRTLVRRVATARWVGMIEGACILTAVAITAYVAGGSIAARRSEASRAAETTEVERSVRDARRVDIGVPGWCPDTSRVQPLSSAGLEGPVGGAAEPFAVAQTRGLGGRAARFVYRGSNGPALRDWPKLESIANLEVLYSFPGDVDRGLLDTCGLGVAEQTWIIVLRAGDEAKPDQLALYLLRTADDWVIWASNDPALQS